MPNILNITVENPDELLNVNAYGAGAVIQVQDDDNSAFTSPTDTGTLAIVANQRSYTFYHATGISATWYRTRYEDNSGTTVSDWSDPFQAGIEGGYLCSLYDVAQSLGIALGTNEDENIIEYIRQVSRAIERYCGRWFMPRPMSGTTTYRVHTEAGRTVHLPRGIRSITSLGIASEDQPESGGTYTVATASDYFISPPPMERDDDDPGYWIELRSSSTSAFYDAAYGAQITGAFGFGAVPPDIQGVAIRASARRYIGKGGGAAVAIGPSGTELLLPDMSGADRATLDGYKRWIVG